MKHIYEILNKIDTPADLKELSLNKMNRLASEIRDLLIASVSRCGGHLAANLGVVELTIALHYVFNSPQDKIIWDVGHQSYVHKILTGRRKKMKTLRQYGGLSGFPKQSESDHDAFDTGHSSTSISAALGYALARDINNEQNSVIAIIGDGALTGGMALEALNHAGHVGSDLIVILNDNEMSISPNVGAMSSYLNRLRTDPSYSRTKGDIELVLNKIPGIGSDIVRVAGKFKDTVKYIMVPGTLFEELGFTYIGPVNGHNMGELTVVLNNAKKMKGPVLIHTITQKGRGYEPAQKNPSVFHGIGPFDVGTGHTIKKSIKTYTELFGEFMVKKAEEDNKVVAITAAMTAGTGLAEFAEKFPDRFFDVGICEQHAVTMASAMVLGGLKPVVAIYSTFLQRAYDQLVHDVALQNLPVIFALDRAGLVGEDGPTHNGVFDISYLRSIPNFTIMAPSNENELMDMLYSSFYIDGPVALRWPRGVGEGVKVNPERSLLETGKMRVVEQGDDLAIISVGRGTSIAIEVGKLLKKEGVMPHIIDARFIKPLDKEGIINLCSKCKYVVTIEEGMLMGGFGSSVSELLMDNNIDVKMYRVGIPDEFVEHGKVDQLFDFLNMDADSILESIGTRWPELFKNNSWELLSFGKR
ncbi:MAG TPA: 1-deoxy-D-xylulose-5-phosphate synthase [Syntrophomonadaceae bacterium]|nr:1-deoxy-D-xylulose-5-phosphate synthase [Syntrophomonadaceae bacterium]